MRPSGEWKPEADVWTIVRAAEGVGYCLRAGVAHELNTGDAVILSPNAPSVFRASQLGILKLEFFSVQLSALSGLLTIAERHRLENLSQATGPQLLNFSSVEVTAQKFTRLAMQPNRESLPSRSALLQFWAAAITGPFLKTDAAPVGHKLRERFRHFIGQLADKDLANKSLAELAVELHCSERHCSRLFREEFGIAFRARQTELRLARAQQLLSNSDKKIIQVALESGYRHLGLFNAMFKKHFGVTPGEWRQQNFSPPPKNNFSRRATTVWAGFILLMGIFHHAFAAPVDNAAQAQARAALEQKLQEVDALEKAGKPAEAAFPAQFPRYEPRKDNSTNAGPKFTVEKYLVSGNTVLPPEKLGQVFTNVPDSFGTNVTFADIRDALGALQMAYRERGFVTVSVGLPQQKLTNATVKIKVTEGRLAEIKVQGNKYYSLENVLDSLPSLHTNMLLNSRVFQSELDNANANRDRQIYPVIGPGLEPGTTELTLKVKDRLPLHARVELNNQATPNTPDNRVVFSAQYDNLWGMEHQVGVQYTFSPFDYGSGHDYYFSQLDLPMIANYSAYYRLPLGQYTSVQQQIDENPGSFGYNEVSHQFRLPPPSGRPELNIYTSRSVSDSGVNYNNFTNVINTVQETADTENAGQNRTLNEGIGAKFSMPLPPLGQLASTISLGVDFKHYQQVSYNTNLIFVTTFPIVNSDGSITPGSSSTLAQGQSPLRTQVNYFPLNLGWNGSLPDRLGTTFFNAQANFNLAAFDGYSESGTNKINGGLSQVAGNDKVRDHYVTLQLGADRVQTIYKDWSVKLHADGQAASGSLFSNEQFGMGGVAGVRGYTDGEIYGDSGWRLCLEPQTPMYNLGMVDGNVPFYVRASAFMDYGQIYLFEKTVTSTRTGGSVPFGGAQLWGCGFNLTANIGSHLDGRLTLAMPLISTPFTRAGDVHFYFGLGAQF